MNTNGNLLEISNLTKIYKLGGLVFGKKLTAVDNVNLTIGKAEPSILGLVGESGSGKTTVARMLLRLVQPTSGDAFIDGRPLFGKERVDLSEFRRYVQPVFQNPFESFSLYRSVDTYLYETALNLGIATNRQRAGEKVGEALESVGLDFAQVKGKYLNQFSGGELQRISVARALLPQPKLFIADEPVSMIDASLRMNIINLFLDLKARLGASFLYITHDLSTAHYICDYIAIMYRGNIVEYGPVDKILTSPVHPYTQLLMDSVPQIGVKWHKQVELPNVEIKEFELQACKFANRCPFARDVCRQNQPPMVGLGGDRRALCFKPIDYTLEYETGVESASDATILNKGDR